MGKKLTKDEFIKKSIKVHGNKYDYSLVDYKTDKIKIKIICPEHGIFKQSPNAHYKYGCRECSIDRQKTTIENFIKKSKDIHGDKYDYSLVEYKNTKCKIKIICTDHGIFEQIPSSHLKGNGCIECAGQKKLTTEEFIKKSIEIYGDKYDYSLVVYKNAMSRVKIICPVHGVFEQRAVSHYDCQCSKCQNKVAGLKLRLNQDDLIFDFKKVHGDKYDYSKVKYTTKMNKVTIICPTHGDFKQLPLDHKFGYGCSKCKDSKGERKIENKLKELGVNYETQKTFENCTFVNKLLFDFYLIDFNYCVEFDGQQHFKSVDFFGGDKTLDKNKKRDNIKNEYCKNNNIHLLRIKYTKFNDVDIIIVRFLKLLSIQ